MIWVSLLGRLRLVDAHQRQAVLSDLAVNHLEGDYPPVTRILFLNPDRQQVSLPWEAVVAADWQGLELRLADLEAAEPAPSDSEALLRRDILDALVLDLQNRRATRANDLLLEEQNGGLVLRGADTGLQAILRRISRGRLNLEASETLYDWKYVEFLHGDPRAVRSESGRHLRISRLQPGEIAHLAEAVPYLHAAELLTLLPDPIAADTLELMTAERQLQSFEELEPDQGVQLLALMAPDVAADLVGRLETGLAKRCLERLPARQSERIIELLRYPEDTVGGLMTNDIVFAPAHLTIGEAREALRDRLKEPDFVYFIYVVEDEVTRRLRGVITLRNLLTSDVSQRLEEVMNDCLSTVDPLDPAVEAAYKVIDSHLVALPVVGNDHRLLGALTVDAAVAQVAPQNWKSQMRRLFS